jgi:hypothetical protein
MTFEMDRDRMPSAAAFPGFPGARPPEPEQE